MPRRVTCYLLTFFIVVGTLWVFFKISPYGCSRAFFPAVPSSYTVTLFGVYIPTREHFFLKNSSRDNTVIHAGFAIDNLYSFMAGLLAVAQKDEVSESPPVEPREKYVLIIKGPAPVLEELNPE